MVTLYLVELPQGDENELTLRARRLLGEAVLILGGRQARDRLVSVGALRGVPLLALENAGPEEVVAAVRAATVDGHVVWAVPGLAQWSEVDRATLSNVLAAGVKVLPVPGGPLWVGCLAASGLPGDRFTFLGCMPEATEARRAQLQRLVAERHILIWWVPAAVLPAALRDVDELLGDRAVAQCSADGIWRGKLRDAPSGALDVYLIVEGTSGELAWTEEWVRERVRQCLAEGASTRDAARTVAEAARWSRRRVYDIALEVGAEQGG